MNADQRHRQIVRLIRDTYHRIPERILLRWTEGRSEFEALLRVALSGASGEALERIVDQLAALALDSPAAPRFEKLLGPLLFPSAGDAGPGAAMAPPGAPPARGEEDEPALEAAGPPEQRPRPVTIRGPVEYESAGVTREAPREASPRSAPSPAAAASGEASEEPARYVNLSFEQTFPLLRPLPPEEGFRPGGTYRLTVRIEARQDARYAGSGEQPPAARPEDAAEPLELHVAVFAQGKAISVVGSPLDTLVWPASGPSTRNATFLLQASEADERRTGRVDVLLYYRTNLIYTARLRIEVLPEAEDPAEGKRPITWTHQEDVDGKRSPLFQYFSRIRGLSERALNLAVRRGDEPDEYLLTAFLGRAELPARVTMRREQLVGYVSEVRKRLDDLRRDRIYVEGGFDAAGEYVGDYTGDAGGYDAAGAAVPLSRRRETFDAFLREMALLGSRLWDELFGDPSGQILRTALEAELREGDVIQVWIDRDATEFVFPWAWIYAETLDPGRRFRVRKERFWGYRYVVEQLPQYPETAGSLPADRIELDPTLRLKVGTFRFAGTTAAQRRFFEERGERSSGALEAEFWDSDEPWESYLPACDSQILYFFSHGHTARPAAETSHRFYDMLARWRAWVTEPVPGESEYLRDYRERGARFLEELDGPLLAETYIKLTYGNLLLRELRNTMDLRRSAPLVFLNMCESAQVFPHISEGLIDVFLRKGARAVVGTEMPMLPHFADLFSRRLFDAFLAGAGAPDDGEPPEIGRVMYRLRRDFLDRGNPLGFAYTLFGSASTRLAAALPSARTPAQETIA